MMGKRHRRELEDEVEKQKRWLKVWEKLRDASISKFIEKLHGQNHKVTGLMAMSWKDGKVKIDGFDFQVNEGVIVKVTSSSTERIKLFSDKKFSLNEVKYFAKYAKKMKEMVKMGAYYEPDSI